MRSSRARPTRCCRRTVRTRTRRARAPSTAGRGAGRRRSCRTRRTRRCSQSEVSTRDIHQSQLSIVQISTNHSSVLSPHPPITAHLTTSSGLSRGRHSHLPQMQSPRLLQRICVVLSDRHPASHSPWGITYHCQAGIFIDERRIK